MGKVDHGTCKSPYIKPRLKEYGNLHLITRGSRGNEPDGGATMRMMNTNMGMG